MAGTDGDGPRGRGCVGHTEGARKRLGWNGWGREDLKVAAPWGSTGRY